MSFATQAWRDLIVEKTGQGTALQRFDFFQACVFSSLANELRSGDIAVAGYTSLIASMWLLAGVILFCMGIIGLYVGRVFESVKLRPVFIVRDRLNF